MRGWVECIKILSNVDIEEWRTSMQGQLKQQQLRFEEYFHVHLKQSNLNWQRNKSQFANGLNNNKKDQIFHLSILYFQRWKGLRRNER